MDTNLKYRINSILEEKEIGLQVKDFKEREGDFCQAMDEEKTV